MSSLTRHLARLDAVDVRLFRAADIERLSPDRIIAAKRPSTRPFGAQADVADVEGPC